MLQNVSDARHVTMDAAGWRQRSKLEPHRVAGVVPLRWCLDDFNLSKKCRHPSIASPPHDLINRTS